MYLFVFAFHLLHTYIHRYIHAYTYAPCLFPTVSYHTEGNNIAAAALGAREPTLRLPFCVNMYVCVCVCTCVHMYMVFMCLCMYTYTYICDMCIYMHQAYVFCLKCLSV